MALPNPHRPTRPFWLRARTFVVRAVTAALVAWGLLAAVVVLAIQFDLFRPEMAVESTGVSPPVRSDWRGVSVGPDSWRQVMSPDSVLRTALALPDILHLATNDSLFSSPQSSVEFIWRPADLSAAWLVELRSPACSCPYDQAQRWNVLRAQLHPATGVLLGLNLLKDITDTEYVRERFAQTH